MIHISCTVELILSISLSFEWGIILQRLEKSNILMLIIFDERHLDCMNSSSFGTPLRE